MLCRRAPHRAGAHDASSRPPAADPPLPPTHPNPRVFVLPKACRPGWQRTTQPPPCSDPPPSTPHTPPPAAGQRSYGLRLAKGARTRLAEDDLASRLLLRAAATAMGVGSQELELGLLPDAARSDGGSRPEEGGGGGLPLEQLQV